MLLQRCVRLTALSRVRFGWRRRESSSWPSTFDLCAPESSEVSGLLDWTEMRQVSLHFVQEGLAACSFLVFGLPSGSLCAMQDRSIHISRRRQQVRSASSRRIHAELLTHLSFRRSNKNTSGFSIDTRGGGGTRTQIVSPLSTSASIVH